MEIVAEAVEAASTAWATFVRDNADGEDKPFQLDRCHALETTTPTVMRYYPRWYRDQKMG